MPDDMSRAWASEDLTDQSKEAFWKAAEARWESIESDASARRATGLIVGAVGACLGLLGAADATWVHLKTPLPEPPGYIFVDRENGAVDPPRKAESAAADFPEAVRRKAVTEVLKACESYIPQTWAAPRGEYYACTLMLSPAEKKRRVADISLRTSPRYPPALLGPNGWAMPDGFPAFVLKDEIGKAPNQTYEYEVRYLRTEVRNGRQQQAAWTANISFQFHPELKMTDADRLLNPYGIQVISFSTVQD